MRNRLIRWLGGVTKEDYDRLYFFYKQQNRMIQETIALCEAHNEWEIVKAKYKQKRMYK